MRVALVNPPWSFEGSIYFGCHEPHLPLEYGYAKALLERDGHEARIFDAQLFGWTLAELRARVEAFRPELTALTTAPSYLFWRCPPPELRVPIATARALRPVAGILAAVGPHASSTPRTAVRKLEVDVAIQGECEEILVRLARTPKDKWASVPSLAFHEDGKVRVVGQPHSGDLYALPPLAWDASFLERHRHHHHRFDARPDGPGVEIEASRGCPYHCTFCAHDTFRDKFRKRPTESVLDEIDGLVAASVRYVYFIDEIFVPDRALLEGLAERDVVFGVQMRIDNWGEDMLELLGRAGCVSIEAGIESLTEEGRSLLAKRCRMSTEELTDRLIFAKRHVPFVQANLLTSEPDDPRKIAAWRDELKHRGVWANDPAPLFAYPGSPEYRLRWGEADDQAWERAHEDYLSHFSTWSDLQEPRPLALRELEEGGPR